MLGIYQILEEYIGYRNLHKSREPNKNNPETENIHNLDNTIN